MPDGSIYFFGRNAAMMALVDQQLKAAGLDAEGYMDKQLLMAQLDLGKAQILVIGGGVEDEPRARLRSYCTDHDILMLEHFGGPAQLVETIGSVLG